MSPVIHFRENPCTPIIKAVFSFVKKNTVVCIAFFCAIVTCFFVPPDSEYLGYFDFKTLSCLFSTLAVVCALRNINFFSFVAHRIVCLAGDIRRAILTLIYITFIGSMLIANDMALITFLPLGYYVLSSTGRTRYMSFTFIMQNIAANLGGMLTPFGNPQNLYLYTYYHIDTAEFVRIMFPPFILAITMITICCLFIKPEKLTLKGDDNVTTVKWRAIVYSVLFVLSIVMVFRILPYYIGLPVIFVALLVLDRKALRDVDYGLLLTFAAFFVFSGNLARIPAVSAFLSALIDKNTLLVSAISCQFISNVPSAILLSKFTNAYAELLVGVNIGGVGTLIASLASLITFKEYIKYKPARTFQYIKEFLAYNFGMLATLLLEMNLVFGHF